jgi:hypothetical protein
MVALSRRWYRNGSTLRFIYSDEHHLRVAIGASTGSAVESWSGRAAKDGWRSVPPHRPVIVVWHDRCDPFSRRVYLRTAFTFVEGITQMMKNAALLFDLWNDPSQLTPEEIVLLREEEVYLKQNGVAAKKRIRLALPENLRFAIACYAKTRHIKFRVDVSGSGWQAFLSAQKIRDRVTHPHTIDDLELSQVDLQTIEDAMSFVCNSTAPLLLRPIERG